MSTQKFTASLVRMGETGKWLCLRIPFDVPKVFGTRARVAVEGRLNGFTFRSSIFPDGDGGFFMMVSKVMQAGGGIVEGKSFQVEMQKAGAPPPWKVPKELGAALRASPAAKKMFVGMSYACRREYVQWIDQARQSETRVRRARLAVERILKNQRIP